MILRTSLFLLAAANELPPVPGAPGSILSLGATGSAGAPGSDSSGSGDDEKSDTKKAADPHKKLKEEWKGKSYAEIAAHHVALTRAGQLDEAAVFHTAVVKNFSDSKAKK